MSQLPGAIPPGVDATAYLNFLSQMQRANAMSEQQAGRQSSRQTILANQLQNQQTAANQQFQMMLLQAQAQAAQQAEAARYQNDSSRLSQEQQFQLAQQQAANQLARQQGMAGSQQQAAYLQMLQQLLQSQGDSYNEARDANEKRRNEILAGRTDTRNRILEQLNNYGGSLVADTNRGYQRNLDNSLAALSHSGLGQSTVNSSIRARNEQERQDSLRRVKDDIIGQYAGTDERLSNNIDDFNERITDSYPENGMINSLTQQFGNMIGQGMGAYGPASPTIPTAGRPATSAQNYNDTPGFATPGGQTPRNFFPGFAMTAGSGPQPWTPPPTIGVAPPQQGGYHAPIGPHGGGGMGAYGNPGPTKQLGGFSSTAQLIPQLAGPAAPPPLTGQQMMQQDTRNQMQNSRLAPWQASPLQQGSAIGLGAQALQGYQPMPALGIFGAGLQMAQAGGGGYFPPPNYGGYGGGGYSRTPLWQRDPQFLKRINKQGLHPEGTGTTQRNYYY